MTHKSLFEFAITYDETTLRAAANFLFRRNWRAKRALTITSLIALLLAGALVLYVGLPSLLWWIGSFMLANLAWWLYLRSVARRNLMRLLGKSQQIRMTEMDFCISSDDGSHTFPWKRFASTGQDSENTYLFLTKHLAYILPLQQVSTEACEFAMAHIAAGTTKP